MNDGHRAGFIVSTAIFHMTFGMLCFSKLRIHIKEPRTFKMVDGILLDTI